MDYHNEYDALKMGELAARKIRGELSTDEEALLEKWLQQSPDYGRAFETLLQEQEQFPSKRMEAYDAPAALKRLLLRRDKARSAGKRSVWYTAASVLLLLSIAIGMYWYNSDNGSRQTQLAGKYGGDILPGGNRATLTLTDGNTIPLNENREGIIIRPNTVTYEDGAPVDGVSYTADQYVTLTTPNGGQYRITLPDGTKVWLNAATSLKYPTAFNGNERKVELTGEAYFEVTGDKDRPFVVMSGGQRAEVLGTAFNIQSYNDETCVFTTLVNGSIRIINTGTGVSKLLKPGEQSLVEGRSTDVRSVDTTAYISWKDGLFVLQQAEMESALRQIGRWYDVRFEPEPGLPAGIELNARLMRNARLEGILNALEGSSGLKFTIEGRRIMVRRE